MKKLVLTLALLATPVLAQAQTGIINATATIPSNISWGTSSGISFGNVAAGATVTASSTIQLTRNVGVALTVGSQGGATLKRAGGSETIPVTYTCGTTTDNSTVAVAFTACSGAQGTAIATRGTPTTANGTVTETYIWIGTLVVPANATGGTYNGAVEITATAN